MMCKSNYGTIRKVNYAMCIFISFSDSPNYAILVIFNMDFS
jgi:hypothetical protein